MKRATLWTRNFNLLIIASILGAAGGIAGGYAMGFLVFDETGSTLASGLLVALRVIPQFLLPILIAPVMDRIPKKPFLVLGDLIGGILYAFAGLYLKRYPFSYSGYLMFSLLLACIGAMDTLAFDSIFPKLITDGFEEKGYSISGMLYPVMNVLVMPVAAVLLDSIGIANILLLQGACSIFAAVLESGISIREEPRMDREKSGFSLWKKDFIEGFRYIRGERGLLNIFGYMAATNGMAAGFSPILVAFFRTAPGFSAGMYSFFFVAEFIGRSVGGVFHYYANIPKNKRFGFSFMVYLTYEIMDMVLLWLPYPMMLCNRAVCGFLGINSATLRAAAIQSYIPEEFRARVNAFEDGVISAASSVLALLVGALGEILNYHLTVTVGAFICFVVCWLTIWHNRCEVGKVYNP